MQYVQQSGYYCVVCWLNHKDFQYCSLCPECMAVNTFVPISRTELPCVSFSRDLMDPKEWWKLTYFSCGVLEFIYILGGKGGHGNSPEDLWNLLPWPQNAQRVGEVSGGSQEQRSPQTRPGMNWNVKKLYP